MAQVDWEPDDPYNESDWWKRQEGDPYTPPPNAAPPPAAAAPPPTTGGGDNRPPKPPDPGDGRVWIWMGDQWGLTTPDSNYTPNPRGPQQGMSGPPIGGGWADYIDVGPFAPRHPDFNFDPFTPSSWGDAENEPGYKASRDQLRKQIEQGAAYRGMARSGAAIGDVYTGLDALSQQNFTGFDNRRFRNWEGNRDLAQLKWGDEYMVDKDAYGFAQTNARDHNTYNYQTHNADLQSALSAWLAQIQSLTQLAGNT